MAEHLVPFYGHLHFDLQGKSIGEAHIKPSLMEQSGEWGAYQPANLKAGRKERSLNSAESNTPWIDIILG